MKRFVALAVLALALQAVTCFAGGPEVSSKEIVAPPAPPESYFRGNEFDIGAFATYVTGTNGGGTRTRETAFDDGTTFTLSSSGSPSGWGGGMDFTYFLPWKYLGFRFQGAGVELNAQTLTVTSSNGFSRSNSSASAAAGVLTGDVVLRLPLDDYWAGVPLAAFPFGGFCRCFTGGGNNPNQQARSTGKRRIHKGPSNVKGNRFL